MHRLSVGVAGLLEASVHEDGAELLSEALLQVRVVLQAGLGRMANFHDALAVGSAHLKHSFGASHNQLALLN